MAEMFGSLASIISILPGRIRLLAGAFIMIRWMVLLLASLAASVAIAADGPVYIGLDAEFSQKSSSSAQAVQQGIQIAIDEINAAGGVLGGRKL